MKHDNIELGETEVLKVLLGDLNHQHHWGTVRIVNSWATSLGSYCIPRYGSKESVF